MSTVPYLSTPEPVAPGIERVSLSALSLYPDVDSRKLFESRLIEFLKVDTSSKIMVYSGGVLTYYTESVIPTNQDSRPPLLLLFGNPAPGSVQNRCFFADVKGKKQHRFWPILERAGIISFKNTGENFNASRTKALFDLDYESPFRIGLAVFYSIPSPASDRKWNGVAGLRKLFGARVLRKIAESEKTRVDNLIQNFAANNPRGSVIAFQKDAYLGVKNNEIPETYMPGQGQWRAAKAQCSCANLRLFRLPPTRYMEASRYLTLFREVSELCERA